MDIVKAAEICAVSLEKENQIENAELLQQKISNIISKNISFKIQKGEGQLLNLLQITENKIYSFDKGTVFVILNNKDIVTRKTKEQIRKSVVFNTDPTFALTSKIKKNTL